jgi:hypothetical protein
MVAPITANFVPFAESNAACGVLILASAVAVGVLPRSVELETVSSETSRGGDVM